MMRRVALVTHDYKASGGASSMTTFLYRALQDSGCFEPDIISLALSSRDEASTRLKAPGTWFGHPGRTEGSRNGLPFTHFGASFSEFEFQRYQPRAALTSLLNGYDLVQFVAGTPPWFRTAARLNKPAFLWTATLTRPDRANRLAQMRGLKRLWTETMTRIAERYERAALKTAKEVFALSDYTLKSVRQIRGLTTGRLATCGVDTDLFKPDSTTSKKCILCVGRLDDPRKNIGLLLQAYARLRERTLDAPELWLVGPELPAAHLQLISSLGLSSHVRLQGPKPASDLPELYRSAIFFVLSSDEEGLGIVLLEALACGTPVISTACGGPETAVKHELTGLLTPVGDVEALTDAMGRLLRDLELRGQMGRRARADAEQRFSLERAGQVFVDAYEQTA